MKQKLFLTSALAMGFVAPAFAEMTDSNTFPNASQGEYMQENTRYIGAATSTNMAGVYQDGATVDAVAEYDTIDYILTAGKYLPKDSETITTCPEGSFCAGGTTVQYNQSSAQGIETCPTCYASSADGSSSNTQCYRACDINNVGDSVTAIAHATAISGNDYYGNGTDTCEPTACENGWHVKAGSGAPDIGTDEGAGYTANTSTGSEYNSEDMSNTIIANDPMAFAVDYGNKGIIKGHGRCSTQSGTGIWNGASNTSDVTTSATLPDSAGGNCYCQLDSYTPVSGGSIALSSPWVFNSGGGSDASSCASYCADTCATGMRYVDSSRLVFRAAVFGAIESSPAMCEANTITINWSDASAADISANNAGTATYGSDVRTPVKAATKKGKTFKGWRFSAPEQTTTGNNG